MTTRIVFVAALALARLSPAQTPSPTAVQNGWQLGQGFDLTLPLSSPTPAASLSTHAPASSPPGAIVQTGPTTSSNPRASESTPAKIVRDRKNSVAASYAEGSIWTLTFVKTKSGLSDEYFKSISASLKPIFEEEKKQKMILDYKILSAAPSDDRDFNVIIMAEYPNMSALDGSRERVEPIVDKIVGPAQARRELATRRGDIREILATKTMREIWLK